MACTTPFDVLRSKVEDLGPELFRRASWKDIWLNLIPRGKYPKGAGYVRSTFTIQRSEPPTDEESWQTIQSLADNPSSGACGVTYNQAYVGHKEDTYKPSMFGLKGPLICQDDLTLYWNSEDFWSNYFWELEKRNKRSVSNRLGNVYRNYCYKASAGANMSFIAGNLTTQPPSGAVDLSGLVATPPTSELTQEMLDAVAVELQEEGADEPNSNGWITTANGGAVFPLYIGQQLSQRILLNNSEFRTDINASYQGMADANPVLRRLGATTTLKNFRHVVNRFPARWALVANGNSINYTSTGGNATTGTIVTASVAVVGAVATVTLSSAGNPTFTTTASGGSAYIRIPTFVQSTDAADATKGQAAKVNGVWRDPSVAAYESVEVLNPWVVTEEILMPVNSLPGAKLHPQNYMGEWNFVTGNDALLGEPGCSGIVDPMHKQGRHYAEYRAAYKPAFQGIFGRMILSLRCANALDTVTCS